KTAGTLSLIGDGTKVGFGPSLPGTYLTPYADCYRCPLKLSYPSCGIECAQFARQVVKNNTTGALAAIIMEPIQGTAGNIVPPPEFMPAVKEIARENDALLISDEMITGFGRTGRWFGCEHADVKPDVVTMGKGLGSGFPVSGLASTETITKATPWGNPSGSSSSYGGNPMAGAAAYASVTIIEEDKLVENAAGLGEWMLSRLRDLQERHEMIGHVDGKGLLSEVELVAVADLSPANREAARALFPAARICARAEDILESQALDFCDICTPPFTHRALVEQAASRGVHVLCEKPLAPTVEDTEQIARAVRAGRVVFQPCHQYRHSPQWEAVSRLLPRIGRVYFVEYEVQRTQAGEGNPNWSPAWRTDRDFAGGGILVDHGAHIFYQLRAILGEPETVQAT